MPFRDTLPYIRRALKSVMGQTFTDFEALLIDDGSSDGSTAVAEEFERNDSRFRIIESGSGLVGSLNLGLQEARGRWIARFDSDDICHRRRLELQCIAAENGGGRTVFSCRVRCFPAMEVSSGYRRYEEWINSTLSPHEIERNLFVESPIPHPTAFFNRSEVLEAGGYRDIGLPEDYELWLRLWSMGFSFCRVPRVLLAWRERNDRFSRNSSMYSLSAFYRTRAMYLDKVPCLAGRELIIAGAGQTARRLSVHLQRAGFSILAFLAPGSSGSGRTIRGVPVLDGSLWKPDYGVPVLGASREHGARERIREFLVSKGLCEWENFVLCS